MWNTIVKQNIKIALGLIQIDMLRSNFNSTKFIVKFAKVIATLMVCYFVYIQFRQNFDEFIKLDKSPDILYFVLSVLLIVVTFLFTALGWKLILGGLSHVEITLPKAFAIMFLSNLGKYIPGKVWQVVGVVYLAKRHGVSTGISVSSFVLTQVFIIPVALIISSFYFLLSEIQLEPSLIFVGVFLFVLSSILIVLLIFKPLIIKNSLNYILKRFNKDEVNFRFSKTRAISILLTYFCVWITLGAGFGIFCHSLINISLTGTTINYLIMIYVAAYITGYLSIVTPGGLGVREGALLYLLSPILAPGEALLVSIGSRLWFILGEIVCSLISIIIYRSKNVTGFKEIS